MPPADAMRNVKLFACAEISAVATGWYYADLLVLYADGNLYIRRYRAARENMPYPHSETTIASGQSSGPQAGHERAS